jgi:hypothetical protein
MMPKKRPAPPTIQPQIRHLGTLDSSQPDQTLRALNAPARLLAADALLGASLWDLEGERLLRSFDQPHITSLGGHLYGISGAAGAPHLARINAETGEEERLAGAAVLGALAVGCGGDTALFDSSASSRRQRWALRFVKREGEVWREHVVATATKPPRMLKLVDDQRGRRACLLTSQDEAQVWSLETGELLHTFKGHGKHAGGAAFSADGRWLVAVGQAKVACWDLTLDAPRWFERHAERLVDTALCISPDDRYVVSAGLLHRRVTIRALTTGAALATFEAPDDDTAALCFSPDGTLYLACGAADLYAVTLPDGW